MSDETQDQASVQAALNAEQARVMEESKPTPTQEETDKAKLGEEVEIVDPGNPEMPPIEEQHEALAEAAEEGEGEGGPEPEPTVPPVNVDVPYVMGNAVVGSTLACTMGNWEGEPDSYAYVWHSDGVEIGSAIGDTYVITEDDVGHSLTCVVTATNAAGSTVAPPSNAVVAVAATTQAARSSRASRE